MCDYVLKHSNVIVRSKARIILKFWNTSNPVRSVDVRGPEFVFAETSRP
jgi:hypothetical protein